MTQFRFALGEPVRIAKTGELATVLKQHRTDYGDFYTARRVVDGAQLELPEEHLRSSAPASNVIPIRAAVAVH
ncbi:MAG: hypothetical protein OJJ21_16705 [Ferrovibrio sp.]|uniref:hypothetical protein n=1 Tax=Ferrovibrio sp. TaxID=1917215 RepID=UPI00261C6811|nr:hypothetical protein [Ferrovibrio sp.]MCW0235243.1 hypothetical protein [Ferrovibrio sp.]